MTRKAAALCIAVVLSTFSASAQIPRPSEAELAACRKAVDQADKLSGPEILRMTKAQKKQLLTILETRQIFLKKCLTMETGIALEKMLKESPWSP